MLKTPAESLRITHASAGVLLKGYFVLFHLHDRLHMIDLFLRRLFRGYVVASFSCCVVHLLL